MSMRRIEKELVKRSVFKGAILFFYSPVEIAKMTNSSISNISKELKYMVKTGILIENNIICNKKTYQLNRQYLKNNYYVNNGESIVDIVNILD